MKSSNLNLEEFKKILSAEKNLYFRALVRLVENTWHIYSLRVDNLPASKEIEPGLFNYGEVAFIFGNANGHQIFDWLEKKTIPFNGQNYIIPELQNNIRKARYPSGMNRFWIKLPHPFSTYEIGHSERDQFREDFEPLIKEGLPSFPNLVAAAYYYLFDMDHRPDRSIPDKLLFCLGHLDCWLENIRLRPSSIKIKVNGTNVKGTRLEMRAGMKHYETILQRKGQKTITLSEGLPESIWVIVNKNGEWLDYRQFDIGSSYLPSRKDVIIENKDKPTEIKGIIARGEGETTEFKRELPSDPLAIAKTVAAFANGSGGVIIVGVADDGKILGVQNPNKQNERFVHIVRDNVAPVPEVRFETLRVDGVFLLVVWIEPGTNMPYGINPKSPKYFIRSGATTMQARPEEVRSMSRRDLQDNKSNLLWN